MGIYQNTANKSTRILNIFNYLCILTTIDFTLLNLTIFDRLKKILFPPGSNFQPRRFFLKCKLGWSTINCRTELNRFRVPGGSCE
jgi:hypothetical protein